METQIRAASVRGRRPRRKGGGGRGTLPVASAAAPAFQGAAGPAPQGFWGDGPEDTRPPAKGLILRDGAYTTQAAPVPIV